MTEAVQTINANFDKTLDSATMRFRFRKDKLGNTRSPVEIVAGVPSIEGIVKILENGGKGLELLQEAIHDTVRNAINNWVADDEKASQATFKQEKFTWEAIANQPREDRRASAISAETWEAFAKDYQEIMPGITGKSQNAISSATEVYLKKFSIIKTRKDLIAKLKDQLALFAEHTKSGDQFADILELLNKKADTYIGAEDTELLIGNLEE